MKYSKIPYGHKTAYQSVHAVILPPTPHTLWFVMPVSRAVDTPREFKTLRAAKAYVRLQVQHYSAAPLQQLELV